MNNNGENSEDYEYVYGDDDDDDDSVSFEIESSDNDDRNAPMQGGSGDNDGDDGDDGDSVSFEIESSDNDDRGGPVSKSEEDEDEYPIIIHREGDADSSEGESGDNGLRGRGRGSDSSSLAVYELSRTKGVWPYQTLYVWKTHRVSETFPPSDEEVHQLEKAFKERMRVRILYEASFVSIGNGAEPVNSLDDSIFFYVNINDIANLISAALTMNQPIKRWTELTDREKSIYPQNLIDRCNAKK